MSDQVPFQHPETPLIPALTPGKFRTTSSFAKARDNLKGFKRVIIGIVLIAVAITIGLEFVAASMFGVTLVEMQDPLSGMQREATLVASLISLLVVPLVTSTGIGSALQRTAGQHVRLGHAALYLKYAPAVFFYTVFWEIASTLAALISFELGLVIRIVVSVLGSFVVCFIIDQKMNPLAAFTASARLVVSNFGQMIVMYMYIIVLILIGVLTLGIGLIWVSPLLVLMVSHQYGQANGLRSATEYLANAAK